MGSKLVIPTTRVPFSWTAARSLSPPAEASAVSASAAADSEAAGTEADSSQKESEEASDTESDSSEEQAEDGAGSENSSSEKQGETTEPETGNFDGLDVQDETTIDIEDGQSVVVE